MSTGSTADAMPPQEVAIFVVEILVQGAFQQVVAGRHGGDRPSSPVRRLPRRDHRLQLD